MFPLPECVCANANNLCVWVATCKFAPIQPFTCVFGHKQTPGGQHNLPLTFPLGERPSLGATKTSTIGRQKSHILPFRHTFSTAPFMADGWSWPCLALNGAGMGKTATSQPNSQSAASHSTRHIFTIFSFPLVLPTLFKLSNPFPTGIQLL